MTTLDFFEAIRAGDTARVQVLIDDDPILVNARSGVSAVLTALYYGQTLIAQILVMRGAQLDIFDAAAIGQRDRLNTLLNDPAAKSDLVNCYASDGFQPLGLAAFFGHIDIVAELIAHNADVNSASRNGQTVQPLHSAVAAKCTDIAQLLIQSGANVNAVQAGGFTPLHGAAQNGDINMINLLLANGANTGIKLPDGQTPYDIAMENGHMAAASLLA